MCDKVEWKRQLNILTSREERERERDLFPYIESEYLEWDEDAVRSIFCLAEIARPQCFIRPLLFSMLSELDKLLEDAPSPFIMQHAARISGVRKRVKSLNSVLKSIQRRIDNMDRMLSAGLAHGMILFLHPLLFLYASFYSSEQHCHHLDVHLSLCKFVTKPNRKFLLILCEGLLILVVKLG